MFKKRLGNRTKHLFLHKDLHGVLPPLHTVRRCSAVCMAEQWGFSTRLYLGRPWWIVIGRLRRKRWPGQKGQDKDTLEHMYPEGDSENVILGAAVTEKVTSWQNTSLCVSHGYVIRM